ncbi:all-trans retinoic acid-induced differentiation factor isoform X3 [Macrotis lagotis]|uniref:all-trans retinoic acid-induced differentiation factor isoform X3 n=1 Tax=Macrotis lagotis TaxID=92651 RepID=UPI003D6938B4
MKISLSDTRPATLSTLTLSHPTKILAVKFVKVQLSAVTSFVLTLKLTLNSKQKGIYVLSSERLDLQNCSLKELDPLFAEAHSAIVLDLRANPLLNIPTSAFRNFTELQTLVVPLKLSCPGGNVSWDNITFDGDSYICQGQRSLCNGTVQPAAALCPENAYCVPDGPGLFQCLCTSDFHGYKCLREGSFPLLMFSGILGTTTFCISILLWGTQLRKIKAS